MRRYALLLPLILLFLPLAQADILVDGRVTDWGHIMPATVDPLDDGAAGSVDFDSLWVEEEYGFLILRVRMNREILMQQDNDISLLIDRDNSSETGVPFLGMGVDVQYRFGNRSGTLYLESGNQTLNQADLALVSAPTVSSDQFEISLHLASRLDGDLLLPSGDIRIAFWDDTENGDAIPDQGGLLFTLPSGDPGTPEELILDHEGTRFMTWNVLHDGFVQRQAPFRRILQAIEPDIAIFEEMWNTTASEVVELMDEWLPVAGGWNGAKDGGDVVLATPFPILGTWAIPDARATAFLVQPVDFPTNVPMLIIGAHPPCCDNNEGRQLEIDAIMAWLRDANEGNGPPEIPDLYAIVITGDMNLVGWAEQLTTFVEGEIVNQGEYGPSFDPDLDGTALQNAFPRHFLQNQVYTWRDDGSSFSSGKLDYIIYSDYLLMAENQFIFDTRTISGDMLDEYGLFEGDNSQASDHIPVVADFSVVINDAPETEPESPDQSWLDWDVSPNPTNAGVRIVLDLEEELEGKLAIFDLLGRWVDNLEVGQFSTGRHAFSWDGRDQHGMSVGSGQYFIRFEGEGRMATQRVTVVQ
ncbi:T9SS type A sorting domain-containing protein [bacterium]|nr:T9SS type A sorting domain-containing protein [bacterium]